MRINQKTKELAYIRRQIRNAINWNKVDDSMPNHWTTENYKRSKYVKPPVKGNYPYYTKSSRAIEVIAERIYDKIKDSTIYKSNKKVTKKQLIKGVLLRFKRNNKIRYGQDFGQHIGVPSDVVFTIDKVYNDSITIIANGYGIIGDGSQYGNGALHIPFTFLKGKYNKVEII